MIKLTKRFTKKLRLAFVASACCLAFFLTSQYIQQDLSVEEYRESLRNYIETYKNTRGGAGGDGYDVGSNGAFGAGSGSGFGKGADAASAASRARARSKNLHTFYRQVFESLKRHSPRGKSAREYDRRCKLTGDIGARPDDYANWDKLTSRELSHCLILSEAEKAALKESHYEFVDSLGALVLPRGSYSGNGIVTVGGGKFSMLSFLIIKTLRNLGTTLPVEVFIPPKDEGETYFCQELLPQYNAKCIFLSDVLPQDVIDSFEFTGYQFKSIAIIASSFENLLLLDADNFPIKPLDNIFDAEPYKSTGMVLWPDFWRRTTNPVYYEIADVPVNYKKRVRNCMDDITPPEAYTENLNDLSDVPLHDLEGTTPDVSTESGQLMISKSRHLPTILLSLYYNVNGPSWYYPIFSQKASGEGDKETFIAGANFYDLPFYQVRSMTAVDGYHQEGGKGFRGVAMLQHDFTQDYMRYQWASADINHKYLGKARKYIKPDPTYSPERVYKHYFEPDDIKEVDIMFVHSNLPKFDPLTLWNDQDLIVNGRHIRSYTNLKRLNGYDLELENFKAFKEHLCGIHRAHFKYLDDRLRGDDKNWKSMCQYVEDRLAFLEQTHEEAIGA
ncbi:LAMI_0C07074g1_1 [Lachancea mirantina]|uniref:LAMI_0C07074g1_1 n=1 Tax=Lachancea mirantina TaxID=1230905 RepID=A0A1G4J4D4_9SACH|nr:LAMI_0C07074g1_1 [Lachancea mirantina]